MFTIPKEEWSLLSSWISNTPSINKTFSRQHDLYSTLRKDSFEFSHVIICRCAELEKEVAVLREKIHHLDDMLKSQQRKVRHMIEQVFRNKKVGWKCTRTHTNTDNANELSGGHEHTGSH